MNAFYKPGHTYTDSEFPQYGWKFRCDTVTTHPENEERTALGWRFFKGTWDPYAYYEDDFDVHRYVGYTEEKATPSGAAATPQPVLCPPCRRGDCEECMTPDRAPHLNPYNCHTPGAGRCPRPTEPVEYGDDYGIGGGF
ncbi:hypothetical protein [Streptomyces sp. NPDC048442]|uniref:hypothetical protein n=1 Tax=Streptomyces sp. NPDC048442 TaxID=3154823 RepID=UPI00343F51E4